MSSYHDILVSSKALNPYAAEFVPASQNNVQAKSPRFWDGEFDKPEVDEPEFHEYNGKKYPNRVYHDYCLFKSLRDNPIFQSKFSTFAENTLCILNHDIKLGLRFAKEDTYSLKERESPRTGYKKAHVQFYLYYKQDDITYKIAYECDDPNDPSTGWFLQWAHLDDCDGFSCDFWGCYSNYIEK